MTDDIVKRLREKYVFDDLPHEAADEIERLREHSRLRGLDIIELGRMVGENEVEIERLRAALQQWRDWYSKDGSVGGASIVYEDTLAAIAGEMVDG